MSEETVYVCEYCLEEIGYLNTGEDKLRFCESCGLIEGGAKEIPLKEFEAAHGL